MREVTPETAVDYLRARGRVPRTGEVRVRALGWGVSNVVMRVDVDGSPPFVLKQARERLRTEALWVSRLDRIWTERAALELLGQVLPREPGAGAVPLVLFSEPDDYLFAMTCAPDDAAVWKEPLLAGQVDPEVALNAGTLLGSIHLGTLDHPALREGPLAETVVFDQLRIDPFYRTIARVHPDLAPELDHWIASLQAPVVRTFVHADFSPKNILVHGAGSLTLVDFETAHAGDPAYDLGFVLSHLLLKAVRVAPSPAPYLALVQIFRDAYLARVGPAFDAGLEARACGHAAACALARVDGTSPVDYLDAPRQAAVRRFARAALRERPSGWDELLSFLAREMQIFSSA